MAPLPPCSAAAEDTEARATAAAMAKAAIEKIIAKHTCHDIVAAALNKAVSNVNKADKGSSGKGTPKRGTSASALAERAKVAFIEGSRALLQRGKSRKSATSLQSPKNQLATKAKALVKKSLGKCSAEAVGTHSPTTESPACVEAAAPVVMVEVAIASPKTAGNKKAEGPAASIPATNPKAPLGQRLSAALKRMFVCGSCAHQLLVV